MKWKKIEDIGLRALKTFTQAFIGAVLVQIETYTNFDKTVVRSILIAEVSAGVSALCNYINNLLADKKE